LLPSAGLKKPLVLSFSFVNSFTAKFFAAPRVTQIPPLDLTEQYQTIQPEVEAAVLRLLASGNYIGGEVVAQFEQQFASYIGTAEAVSCNSGTDALYLALRALDIGPGDEVITTPFTFFATAETISAVGARPVFADIEADSFNLDLAQVEAAITPRTRAIMPVHLFGQPVDMVQLGAIAQRHNLYLIEDAAQAAGAQWQGQKVGSWGHVGCFSFFPTKNLGACGDGGCLTTNDAELAEKVRMLRQHGMRQRYYHEAFGVTSRLDALQAAILSIKLKQLDQWNGQRRLLADRYGQLLAGLPGIVPPRATPGGEPVWHQYTLRVQPCGAELSCQGNMCDRTQPGHCRDWLKGQLAQQDVQSMIYYPVPLHLQSVYQDLGLKLGSFPVAEQAACEVLSLPMFPELTFAQQDQVVAAIQQAVSALVA
jgi:dTDP-4-amino-4,6-dideoxygalactose transaminase